MSPLSTTTPYHFMPGFDPVNEGVLYNNRKLLTTDLPSQASFWAAATVMDVGLVGADRNESWQFSLYWTDMTGSVFHNALSVDEVIDNTSKSFEGAGVLKRFDLQLVPPPSGFVAKYLVFGRSRLSAPQGAGLESGLILDSIEVQF